MKDDLLTDGFFDGQNNDDASYLDRDWSDSLSDVYRRKSAVSRQDDSDEWTPDASTYEADPFHKDSWSDSSSRNKFDIPLSWGEDSAEEPEKTVNAEYEPNHSLSIVRGAELIPRSDDWDVTPITQSNLNVNRPKSSSKPFKIPVAGYLTASCLIAALAAFAFFSFSKLYLNVKGDPETLEKLSTGSSVRFDDVNIGFVKELDAQNGKAKLELQRDSLIPKNSKFEFSSREYGEHIEIRRGDSTKMLHSGETVDLAPEMDPQKIVKKGAEILKKVADDTGIDYKLVLCCFIFLTCIVAAFIFRRVKAASSLACFGTFLSFLWLMIRCLPAIEPLVSTLLKEFK